MSTIFPVTPAVKKSENSVSEILTCMSLVSGVSNEATAVTCDGSGRAATFAAISAGRGVLPVSLQQTRTVCRHKQSERIGDTTQQSETVLDIQHDPRPPDGIIPNQRV